MQAAFQKAAVPFRVLGLRLHPYTLGHDLLLYTLESGFSPCARTPPTYEDLLISVWVCAQKSHEEALRKLSRRATRLWISLWGAYCGRFDIGEAFSIFGDYIASHTKEPEYWIERTSSGGEASGTPFFQVLKVSMMKELGMSEREAWNTHYTEAHLNFLTLLEASGKIRLISDKEKAIISAARDPDNHDRLQAWASRVGIPKKK